MRRLYEKAHRMVAMCEVVSERDREEMLSYFLKDNH